MCSRFTTGRKGLSPEDQRLEDEFVVAFQGLPRREISPRDSAVVLARGKAGVLRAVTMRWGFVRPWGSVFNARSEDLTKAIWQEAAEKRRCAVPMEMFFEWKGTDPRNRRKFRFLSPTPAEDLWVAGMWESSRTGDLDFSILTKAAPSWMESFHDRCPYLLRREDVVPYLDKAIDLGIPPDVPLTFKPDDDGQTMLLPSF